MKTLGFDTMQALHARHSRVADPTEHPSLEGAHNPPWTYDVDKLCLKSVQINAQVMKPRYVSSLAKHRGNNRAECQMWLLPMFFFLPVCRVQVLQRDLKAIADKAELPRPKHWQPTTWNLPIQTMVSLTITLVTSPSSALCFWLGLCFYKWPGNFVDFVNCSRGYVIGLFPRHPSTPSFCGCFQNNVFGSVHKVSVSIFLRPAHASALGRQFCFDQ